jgi:hypothetical protein
MQSSGGHVLQLHTAQPLNPKAEAHLAAHPAAHSMSWQPLLTF